MALEAEDGLDDLFQIHGLEAETVSAMLALHLTASVLVDLSDVHVNELCDTVGASLGDRFKIKADINAANKKQNQPAVNLRRKKLTDQFCIENQNIDPGLLWDISLVLILQHAKGNGLSYTYMGWHVAKEMHMKVMALKCRSELTVMGTKGTGKSTIAETMASFMIATGQRAIYLSGLDFVKDPKSVVLHGLFLIITIEEQAQLKELAEFDNILSWCSSSSKPICFFADDFEVIEVDDKATKIFYTAAYNHMVVSIISTNIDKRIQKLQSNKDRKHVQNIDGPYSEDELQTWVAQSRLEVKDDCDFWVHFDYWTGGMPRLLVL